VISPLTPSRSSFDKAKEHWSHLSRKHKAAVITGCVVGVILTSAFLSALGTSPGRGGAGPTVTVTAPAKPGPTVYVKTPLPQACRDYAAALDDQYKQFTDFTAAYGNYGELTDRLNTALLSGDVATANELKQQIAQMDSAAGTALGNIIDGNKTIATKKSACEGANR
jgi:hypothetical protein